MDSLLGGLKNAVGESKKEPEPEQEQEHHESSPSDLLSSAKVLGEAAQSALRNETDKLDKAKLSEAADDLLAAATKYGKLEGTAAGQYVEKAEAYLHQYSSSQPSTTTAPSEPTTTIKPPSKPEQAGGEEKSGGVGDYFKMAQGFLSK